MNWKALIALSKFWGPLLKVRLKFVENYVKPFPGMKILDLGCGPEDILAYLPDVEYWGYGISEAYIAQAKTRFGNGGGNLTASNLMLKISLRCRSLMLCWPWDYCITLMMLELKV